MQPRNSLTYIIMDNNNKLRPMSRIEIMMWQIVLRKAQSGDKEAMESVEAENNVRKKNNLPSIQESIQQSNQLLQQE